MTQKQERNTSTFPGSLCGFWWCLSIILLTVLDQWTKHLAEIHLKGNQGISLIPGVLELSYLENRGMAFWDVSGQTGTFSYSVYGLFRSAFVSVCAYTEK